MIISLIIDSIIIAGPIITKILMFYEFMLKLKFFTTWKIFKLKFILKLIRKLIFGVYTYTQREQVAASFLCFGSLCMFFLQIMTHPNSKLYAQKSQVRQNLKLPL